MTLLLIIAVIVVVPWVAVVVVGLAIVSMSKIADDRHASISVSIEPRPCPLCHVEGVALIDPDGVALCTSCRCSYESVQL